MTESIPLFDQGNSVTGYCTAAVTGARFLTISGNRSAEMLSVRQTNGQEAVIGVAAHDAVSGATVGIHHGLSQILPVTVGTGGVTAGSPVTSDASGQAITASAGNRIHGVALDDAAAGALVLVDRAAR